MKDRFVHIILPISPGFVPTYRAGWNVHAGQRVKVNFAGRDYIGVVAATDVLPDIDESKIMDIKEEDTGLPDISEAELRFWYFLSEYYLCPIGDVYKSACPLLKTRSEQTAASARNRRREAAERMRESLEHRLEKLKARQKAKISELGRHREGTAVSARLKADISTIETDSARIAESIARLSLQAKDSTGTETSAIRHEGKAPKPAVMIGNDRTDRYIGLVRDTLAKGRDALVLIPEIAVGDTLQKAFESEFGQDLFIHNSSCSPRHRRVTAEALRDSARAEVVIGTRISLFLPYRDLGLVIVDEEQDSSYKQDEPSPRFNTRDAAIVLAGIHCADAVLGSSCPSLETLHNLQIGKYIRTDVAAIPAAGNISIIDLSAEKRKRGVRGHFSFKLVEAVRACDGDIRIIRTWEEPDELKNEAGNLFPEKEITILTMQESRCIIPRTCLTVILQADALFPKNDFRADEKALQAIMRLAGKTEQLIIQTTRADNQVFRIVSGKADSISLLAERKLFFLPPYSRLVDILIRDGNMPRLALLGKELVSVFIKEGFTCNSTADGQGISIRISLEKASSPYKKKITEIVRQFESSRRYQGHIVIDVDPL